MRGFELQRDGQIVYTLRSTVRAPDGREEHLTRGIVGRKGQVFKEGEIAQFVIDQIENGEIDYLKEIELPDPEDQQADSEPSSLTVTTESVPDSAAGVEHAHGDQSHTHTMDFEAEDVRDLMSLAEQHNITVEGTGRGGNIRKVDVVFALQAVHMDPEG